MSQKHGLIPDEQLGERRMLSESYTGGKLCHQGDLVLNRLKAHLGVFALAPQFGVISPDYTVLKPNTKRIIPAFTMFVLKSEICRKELRTRVCGVIEGFWRLYTDDFNTIALPLPLLNDQQVILDYIDSTTKKIDLSISYIEQQISLLHEYRASLISDVVTGKMDVRDVVVPEYENVEEFVDGLSQENEEVTETEE
jgi:type I restriction enzyme S subunit